MLLNCGLEEDSWEFLGLKEIKPVNPKGNQPWIFIGRTDAEALMLWTPDTKSQIIRKDPDAVKDWRQEEKRMTQDEMAGWYHQLNGHKFEQALGDGEEQGSLACYSLWVQRVGHDWATKQQQQKFITAQTWKLPRCPSAGEWINKWWYIQTTDYYSALKRNELQGIKRHRGTLNAYY